MWSFSILCIHLCGQRTAMAVRPRLRCADEMSDEGSGGLERRRARIEGAWWREMIGIAAPLDGLQSPHGHRQFNTVYGTGGIGIVRCPRLATLSLICCQDHPARPARAATPGLGTGGQGVHRLRPPRVDVRPWGCARHGKQSSKQHTHQPRHGSCRGAEMRIFLLCRSVSYGAISSCRRHLWHKSVQKAIGGRQTRDFPRKIG